MKAFEIEYIDDKDPEPGDPIIMRGFVNTGNIRRLSLGADRKIIFDSTVGIYAGANTFSSAIFSVSLAGVLTTTNAVLGGTFTGTSNGDHYGNFATTTSVSTDKTSISSTTHDLVFHIASGYDIVKIGNNSNYIDIKSVAGFGNAIYISAEGGATGLRIYQQSNAEGIIITNTGSSSSISINNTGTGRAILLDRSSGTGTNYLLYVSSSNTALGSQVAYFVQEYASGGSALDISSASSITPFNLYSNNTSTSNPAALIVVKNRGAGIKIDKNKSGYGIDIDIDDNQDLDSYGLSIDVANASYTARPFIFQFLGQAVIVASSLGTLVQVARIKTAEGTRYIPLYNGYS